MGFLSIFRKSQNVSVIPLNGIIAPNMGRRKGLNLNEIDKNIEDAFSVKNLKAVALQINSPGGSVTAGMAIYDTMQFIGPDVATICTGIAASMAAVLLCSGQKGKRSGLTHSRVMIHQPLGSFQGQATDFDIQAKEILSIRKRLNQILSNSTGQTIKKIESDTERDNFMSGDEASDYGLIDKVISQRSK